MVRRKLCELRSFCPRTWDKLRVPQPPQDHHLLCHTATRRTKKGTRNLHRGWMPSASAFDALSLQARLRRRRRRQPEVEAARLYERARVPTSSSVLLSLVLCSLRHALFDEGRPIRTFPWHQRPNHIGNLTKTWVSNGCETSTPLMPHEIITNTPGTRAWVLAHSPLT